MSVQCKYEWFVIGEYVEMSTFEEISKVFDCEIYTASNSQSKVLL